MYGKKNPSLQTSRGRIWLDCKDDVPKFSSFLSRGVIDLFYKKQRVEQNLHRQNMLEQMLQKLMTVLVLFSVPAQGNWKCMVDCNWSQRI